MVQRQKKKERKREKKLSFVDNSVIILKGLRHKNNTGGGRVAGQDEKQKLKYNP